MKTAKILSGVAIGVALISIGVAIYLHYKSKNQNPVALGIATRESDLADVIE